MSDYPIPSRFDPCTRVYWDVVDFPFPIGLKPELIYSNMKLILEELLCAEGELSIMAYASGSDNLDDGFVDAYKKAGITIIPQPAGVRSMLPDIAWWNAELFSQSQGYRRSLNYLMIITKKKKKDTFFHDYLESMSYNETLKVLVALPQDPPPPPTRLQTVSFEWLLTRLLDPTDQSGAVQDNKRMRIESHETIMPSSPVETIMPSDTPVESMSSSETFPCVFWDNMDFSFCRFYEPALIRSIVGTRDEFLIMVYVDADAESFPDALVHYYKEAGITIIPQRISRYAVAHCMSVDIVLWAMENPASYVEPRKLLVLSDNVEQGTDFFNALEALKDRYYDVVVLPPSQVPPHHSTVFRNHRPKMSREEAVGLPSLFKHYVARKIRVFWDVQGCPTGLSSIVPVVRKKGYPSELRIRPYVDEHYDGGDWLHFGSLDCGDSSRARCIRVVTQGDKYTKVTRMLLDIVFWAMNHGDGLQQSLMLISQPSKDTKCDTVLQALERRGFNVMFRPSDKMDSFESLCKTPPVLDLDDMYVTEVSRRYEPVVLLWPIENCPPSNPMKFFHKFRSFITEKKGYVHFESMRAYVDTGKISDELREVYRKSPVGVRLVSEEEFGKITHMLMDLIRWTKSREPLNFLVISKPFRDATWDSVVEALKDKGYNVHFVTPDYMLTFGTSLWSARSLLDASCSSST